MLARWMLALVSMLLLVGSPLGALAAEEEHDDAGRLVRTVDDEGRETLYRYDDQGQLVEKRHSDGTVERFQVDPDASAN